jgi:hypothetical protein
MKRNHWCIFAMKQMYYHQDIVKIMYYNLRYANDNGLVVHVKTWQGDQSQFAL